MQIPVILSFISTTAIVAGGIFAGVQLLQFTRQRSRDAALQMLHSFRTPEFLKAVDIVFELPEGLSKAQVEERVGDKIICILTLFGTFENLGILVYRGDMEIRLVEDFFSGIIILSGRKLKNYLSEVRQQSDRLTYYEWYQWLYEQLERRESKTPPIPAYIAFRDWKSDDE